MLTINESKCDGCGTCVAVCPRGAVVMPEKAVIDGEVCVDCGICVNICPVAAIVRDGENGV